MPPLSLLMMHTWQTPSCLQLYSSFGKKTRPFCWVFFPWWFGHLPVNDNEGNKPHLNSALNPYFHMIIIIHISIWNIAGLCLQATLWEECVSPGFFKFLEKENHGKSRKITEMEICLFSGKSRKNTEITEILEVKRGNFHQIWSKWRDSD